MKCALAIFLVVVSAARVAADAKAAPPKIIFILADDITYGDFGCYGATHVKMPNIYRLAREGLRLCAANLCAAH